MTNTVETMESRLSPKIRIDNLKKQMMGDTLPRVYIERACLVTESYQQTEGEPTVIRRAKALSHILSNMTIGIRDNELLVGDLIGDSVEELGVRGCPILIEYSCDWLERDLDELETRDGPKFLINEEKKETLRGLFSYWRRKTLSDRFDFLMPEELRAKYAEYKDITVSDEPRLNSWAHITVDYEKAIKQGLEAMAREAEEYSKKMDPSDPAQLAKFHFYRAVVITHKAVMAFANRYAELAREMESKEQNSRRKAELREIAEICERIPAKPARTFFEALQSLWFVQMALRTEGGNGAGIAPGRMDQYLYPYYRKDIEEGRLDRERAKELVVCFFIKLNSFGRVMPSGTAQLFGGGGWGTLQNVMVGGLDRNGNDATNELSYLLLEADGDLGLTQPETVVRISKDTPRDFVIKACEVAKKCCGKFKFVGDKVTIAKMLAHGYTEEEARDYVVTGCLEPAVQVITSPAPTGHMNLPLVFELALNDGVSILSGKQLGPHTGNAAEFKSINDVLKAFRTQLAYFMEHNARYNSVLFEAHVQAAPLPFHSSLVKGCLEKGTDLTAGGAIHSSTWLSGVGIINVSDSVAAIKKCVFDEAKITMTELLDALRSNFEGKEDIRQMLLEVPKFGNDDDYVDLIAREIVALYSDEFQKVKFYGGKMQPIAQLSGLQMIIPMGQAVGASAEGRKSGEPLADGGISPVQGKNIKGAAATYKSVGKLDHVKLKGGEGLNMRFSPDALKDDRAIEKFATLLQTYFNELDGYHVQFNIVSTDMLRDAQRNPDKYRDLLVRIATYSAYFIELHPDVQNHIINRTELGI